MGLKLDILLNVDSKNDQWSLKIALKFALKCVLNMTKSLKGHLNGIEMTNKQLTVYFNLCSTQGEKVKENEHLLHAR